MVQFNEYTNSFYLVDTLKGYSANLQILGSFTVYVKK